MKEAVAALRRGNENSSAHIKEMRDILYNLNPKIEHIHAFSVFTVPHLATKEDIAILKVELKESISERPKLMTILAVVALIVAFLAMPFWPDWWARAKLLLP